MSEPASGTATERGAVPGDQGVPPLRRVLRRLPPLPLHRAVLRRRPGWARRSRPATTPAGTWSACRTIGATPALADAGPQLADCRSARSTRRRVGHHARASCRAATCGALAPALHYAGRVRARRRRRRRHARPSTGTPGLRRAAPGRRGRPAEDAGPGAGARPLRPQPASGWC